MMVNLGVGGYTKTLNQRKTIRKIQKNNLLETKTKLKPKRWKFDLLPPVNYDTDYDILYFHTIE